VDVASKLQAQLPQTAPHILSGWKPGETDGLPTLANPAEALFFCCLGFLFGPEAPGAIFMMDSVPARSFSSDTQK